MKLDVLSVLEAAYRDAENDESWLAGVLEVAAPALDRGLGVVASLHDASGSTPRFSSVLPSSAEARKFARIAGRVELEPSAADFNARLYARGGFATASQKSGLGRKWPLHPAIEKHHVSIGVRDVIGLTTSDPTGRGCALLVPLPRVWSPPEDEIELWDRVAAHLAAGFRLRNTPAVEGGVHAGEAVVSPGGRVEHAEGVAKSKEARASLERGVRAMERARGSLRRRDPHEAVAIWRGLVAGRWSLVDSFDHDGRRYVVARRNDPVTLAWKTLSERERQAVAYAALGHSNKLIAYELGLSTSTVAMHLSRAASKVGVRTRVELIQAYAAQQASRREPKE